MPVREIRDRITAKPLMRCAGEKSLQLGNNLMQWPVLLGA